MTMSSRPNRYPLALRPVGEVGGYGQALPAGLSHSLSSRFGVLCGTAHDGDRCPGGTEGLAEGRTDAAPAPRDERDASSKAEDTERTHRLWSGRHRA